MKIGLLSDTHGYLDPAVFRHFSDCQEVWHAGDIGTTQLADQLEDFRPFRAVYGNIDGKDLRVRYPEDLFFDCNGLTVFMTHIGGYPGRYAARIRALLLKKKPRLFISGHSHILKVMPDPKLGLLHINPGACGRQGWHKVKTLVRFRVEQGRIEQLEVIELGPRSGG